MPNITLSDAGWLDLGATPVQFTVLSDRVLTYVDTAAPPDATSGFFVGNNSNKEFNYTATGMRVYVRSLPGSRAKISTASASTPAPSNRNPPVTPDTGAVGAAINPGQASWDNGVTSRAWAWKRDGVAIGVTTLGYTPVAADAGRSLTVEETATNGGGSTTIASSPIAIAPIALAISGTPPAMTVGTAWSFVPNVVGGRLPYRFYFGNNAFPNAQFSRNYQTGGISGTSTVARRYFTTIYVEDADGVIKSLDVDVTSGAVAPTYTAARATNAGFAPVFEQSPQNGISQTSRCITAPFNEPFQDFQLVLQLFRTRVVSVTGFISDGAGNVGDILNVTAVTSGAVVPNIPLTASTAVTIAGTYVVSQLTGVPGGIGTYKLSAVQTGGIVTSTTVASTYFTDELYQNAGAQITWEAGFLDVVTQSMTNIPPRTRITMEGANSKLYDYANWDKTVGLYVTDKARRPRLTADPMEIWLRALLPASGFGLPANKPACSVFANRWWGNEVSTSAATVDPITGTTIARVEQTDAGLSTLCIAPVAMIIYTEGGAQTVVGFGDSRLSFTGLAGKQAGVIVEPAGFGDSMGDVFGRGSPAERGIHGVAKQHSLMLGKPTDQALMVSSCPGAWRFRRQVMATCGANDAKTIVDAYGQNDNNNGSTVFSANMSLRVGQVIHGDTTTGNVYIVTAGGAAGSTKPSSVAPNTDITLGNATVRYIGTQAGTQPADNGVRQGMALVARLTVLNAALRAAMPGIKIVQEGLGPYSSSTDAFLTAQAQSDGFNMLGGKYLQAQLDTVGPSVTGADRYVTMMPVLAGSRTTTGGPDDKTRSWKTNGTVTYLESPDGIHTHNKGAEDGKVVYTKLALTGAA